MLVDFFFLENLVKQERLYVAEILDYLSLDFSRLNVTLTFDNSSRLNVVSWTMYLFVCLLCLVTYRRKKKMKITLGELIRYLTSVQRMEDV